jgi:hypothetical protein
LTVTQITSTSGCAPVRKTVGGTLDTLAPSRAVGAVAPGGTSVPRASCRRAVSGRIGATHVTIASEGTVVPDALLSAVDASAVLAALVTFARLGAVFKFAVCRTLNTLTARAATRAGAFSGAAVPKAVCSAVVSRRTSAAQISDARLGTRCAETFESTMCPCAIFGAAR